MNIEHVIPEEYRWESLVSREGIELKEHYQRLLLELGSSDNSILRQIYADASTSISEPKNLEKIIKSIDNLDWYNAEKEGLGDLYEGLLEKTQVKRSQGRAILYTACIN